jgi:hypothetical protein
MKKNNGKSLIDFEVNVKVKLALLWTSLMFLYIYADYFQLMAPKQLESMINLQTPMGPATPRLLVSFSILLIVPALMIALCLFLRPLVNKWMNIIVAILYAIISILIIISDIGSEWQVFLVLYNVVELFVFAAIIWQAHKWPRTASVHN